LKEKLFKYILFQLIALLLFGCAKHQLSTLHLGPHEKLISKNKLEVNSKIDIDKEDLASYIRQKPNHAILFGTWKFGLQWRNLWYREKSGKKRPAVILDSSLVRRSENQMTLFMKNEGYYNAEVTAEIKPIYFLGNKKWETKKVKIYYTVNPKNPLVIDSTDVSIKQNDINKHYNEILNESHIIQNTILRIEDLEDERNRITEHLNNNGYYKFAENFISFDIDSTRGCDSAIIVTKIKQPKSDSIHYKYYLNNIYVNTSYDPYSSNNETTDTILYQGVYMISKGKSHFKPNPLYRSLFIHPNELYDHKKESLTFRQFANLQMFSFIKIEFKEVKNENGDKKLDAYVLLKPSKRMSVSGELMGIFREGFGGTAQLSFNKKNAFGNSEILNFTFYGGLENLKQGDEDDFNIVSTVGPRLSLTFPRLFMFPKITKSIRKSSFPKTTFSAYYNFQERIEFKRYLTNIGLTYTWNEGKYKTHTLSILDMNFAFITKDSKILTTLSSLSPAQRFKFEDAISSGVKYNFLFNNQGNKKIKNPTYFVAKSWLIGTSALVAKAFGFEERNPGSNAITLAKIRYATFFKLQGDLRKFLNFTNEQQIALRTFLGAGIPLDKHGVIPFDQLYFVGGANSIRGWRQRTLGQGSYLQPDDNVDKLGEIKIELNVEYRFPVTSIIKGALFIDAGNVWTEKPDIDTEIYGRKNFDVNRFHKEFAVSPGIGVRLDFDFFLFRVDLGVPLKQAYTPSVWNLETNKTQLNFGVGYPF
tara:strand:+ start:363 stop:2636 length:2274 start_codon:yes stop_codon:yes gene_type:complete